jgi:hypothetical protein
MIFPAFDLLYPPRNRRVARAQQHIELGKRSAAIISRKKRGPSAVPDGHDTRPLFPPEQANKIARQHPQATQKSLARCSQLSWVSGIP